MSSRVSAGRLQVVAQEKLSGSGRAHRWNGAFLGAFIALALSLVPAEGQAAFEPGMGFAAGSSPRSVMAADSNGKGKIDLVTTDDLDRVAVSLNQTEPVILPKVVSASPLYPASMLVTFSETMGSVALVASSYTISGAAQGTLTATPDSVEAVNATTMRLIWLSGSFASSGLVTITVDSGVADTSGQAMGTPRSATTMVTGPPGVSFDCGPDFDVGQWPVAIATGDFNGDGKKDIVTANSGSDNVSVLLGDGSGGFGAATYFGVGTAPYSVAVHDFNGDGKSDLAVANSKSNDVSILVGDGRGGFGAVTNLSVDAGPTSVVVGDLNGDGKSDLAVANRDSNNVSVLLGDGSGGFGLASNFSSNGPRPTSLAIIDFNGDGNADLAVANSLSMQVSILLGDGSGSFQPFAISFQSTSNCSLSVCDFNSSGTGLLAAGSGDTRVWLCDGSGWFTSKLYLRDEGSVGAAAGDFNGDGKTDLATIRQDSHSMSVSLGNGSGGFGDAVSYGVGVYPRAIMAADFNGDGKSDLAVANGRSNSVSVLLGDGSGRFGAVRFDVGTDPVAAAVGDFNGDGNSDLAVANNGSRNVSVLLGDGSGGFGAANNFDVSAPPNSVVAADFNGDGKTDLAVADGYVSVLLGNGLGGFGAATDYDVGKPAYSLVQGDFNGDGRSDLAFVDWEYRGDGVFVLPGKGDGSFGAAISVGASSNKGSMAVGDLNGDGKSDIVSCGGGSRWVLLGTASGYLSVANTTYMSSSSLDYPSAGDFNGDGKSDVAAFGTTYLGPSRLWVCLGNGSGGFGAPTSFNVGTTGGYTAVGDFNNDGKTDLAVANGSSNSVSVIRGNGSGGFGTAFNFFVGAAPERPVVGDFNRDGQSDLVVPNYDQNNVSVLLNSTIHHSAIFPDKIEYAAGATLSSVAKADLNGDGKADLVVVDASSNAVSVLLGDDSEGFGLAASFGVGDDPCSVAAGDFNCDGKSDLAVANGGAGNVSVLLGNGLGSFGTAANFDVQTSPSAIAASDLNGDSKVDLAVANKGSNSVSVLLSNGQGSFGVASNFEVGDGPVSLAIGDLNGDGKSDLAVANQNSNNVSVLLGTGSGSFGAAANFSAGDGPVSVVIGDLNRDGKADLAVANRDSSNVSVLLGDGSGGFGAATNYSVGSAPSSLLAADLNGDGRIDLTTFNRDSADMSVLFGDGTGVFGSPCIWAAGSAPVAAVTGDFNRDGKSDFVVVNGSSDRVSVLLNRGGQFALGTTSVAPASVDDYTTEALLKVTATHRGISGDTPVKLAALHLGFDDGSGTTMTSAQLNAIADTVSIWYDANGSGAFEPAADKLLSIFSGLLLDANGQAYLSLPDGAPECSVPYGAPGNYFVVIHTAANASGQHTNTLRVTHATSSSRGEDPSNDSPLILERPQDVASPQISMLPSALAPSFVATPDPATTTETITFDASASYHKLADKAIVSYEWDYDGDGNNDASGITASHRYGQAGTYTARLTVTDNCVPPKANIATYVITVADLESPTCTVSSPSSPTKANPVCFSISFSEPVTGLTAGSFVLTGGTAGPLSGSGAGPYTFSVTPTSLGEVTCQVLASVVQDAAGNRNAASNTASVTYDTLAPTCTISSSPNPTNANPMLFTIRFSEPVTGLAAGSFALTGGTAGSLSGSGAGPYMFSVTPTGQGDVTCQVPANVVQDAAGNGNTASNQGSALYDSLPPTAPVIVGLAPASDTGISNTDRITKISAPVIVGTGEPGTSVTVRSDGIEVGTGNVDLAGHWSVAVGTLGEGPRTLLATVVDLAGNISPASSSVSVTIDTIGPTATMGAASPSPRHTPVGSVSITFSAPVYGFDPADLSLTRNGVSVSLATAVLNGSGANWTLENLTSVTSPDADYELSLNVSDITDAAGNALTGLVKTSWVMDTSADLVVTKGVYPCAARTDELVTYTLEITNAGPTDTENATLTDPLPPNVEFVAESVPASNVDGTTRTWNLGAMAVGDTTTITLQARVLEPAVITNTASVVHDRIDPNPNNNVSFATVAVGPGADLAVAVTSDPAPPMLGQPLHYVLGVTNQGPDTAEDVVVSDVIPVYTVLSSAAVSQGSVDLSGGHVAGDLGSIAREATATMTVTVIPQQTGEIVNLAGVTSSILDHDTSNNVATTRLNVVQRSGPDLIADSLTASLSKRGPVKMTIRTRVLNRGNVTSGRTSVLYYLSERDHLDASAKQIGSGNVTSLKPGRSQQLSSSVRIDRPATAVYVIAVIDPTNKVDEGNELNNVRVFGPLQ